MVNKKLNYCIKISLDKLDKVIFLPFDDKSKSFSELDLLFIFQFQNVHVNVNHVISRVNIMITTCSLVQKIWKTEDANYC